MKGSSGSLVTPPLGPKVTLPEDEGLPGLSSLFDQEWVWQAFCAELGTPAETPNHIRPRHLRYRPGASALLSYVAESRRGQWVLEDQFAIEMVAGKPERVFRYPDDPYLPGLRQAASALEAHQLVSEHVSISPYQLRVEEVRYRPAARAVFRHIASWRHARPGKVTLFARVMSPRRIDRFLAAAEVTQRSGDSIPRLAGCWAEGGVVWLSKIPGRTVRRLIQKGAPPRPDLILDHLEKLWSSPLKEDHGRSLNLSEGFRMTQGLFDLILVAEPERRLLEQATNLLGPFSESWQPSALAHNDFYDDQLLLTPDGRLDLVDFEEAGAGDPLLDVGNALAHLRWMARFGTSPEAYDAYRRRIRSIALERFGWDRQALDIREAFAMFRLSSNAFRQLRRNWSQRVADGLALTAEVSKGVQ